MSSQYIYCGYIDASTGLPRIYKVATSNHHYSCPCPGDQIYAWEPQSASEVPQIRLPSSVGYAPTVTLNSFGSNTFVAIYDKLMGGEFSGACWKSNTRVDDVTFTYTWGMQSPMTLAHVGICFPSTGRYIDKTNHTDSYLFNGLTAHIAKARAAQYPKGVKFYNTILFSASSNNFSLAAYSHYFRQTSGDLQVDQAWGYNSHVLPITVSGSSEQLYLVSNNYTYYASDIRMTDTDIDNATGNGFGVRYTSAVTIKIYGCYMSAISL